MIDVVAFDACHMRAAASIFCHVFSAPPWNEYWTLPLATSRLAAVLDAPGGGGAAATTDDDQLLGFAVGSHTVTIDGGEPAYLLQEMAVDQQVQCQGIGTRLLRAVEDEAARAGLRSVEVLTIAGQWPCYFYEKNGYSHRGVVERNQIILGRTLARAE